MLRCPVTTTPESVTRLGAWTTTTLRVRYAETDAMGIAHHAEYLAWYEVGRTEWIRSGAASGKSYRALEEAGFMLPVVEVSSRHHASARYDDVLDVRSRLTEASRARLLFDYEVLRQPDGLLLATGRSVHAVTDRLGRVRRLPPEVLAWLVTDADGPPNPTAPSRTD
jgi:acyl-CoA thioester hydrolase